MPESLSIHEPLFVNTIGHASGMMLFALLLLLLLADSRRRSSRIPGFAVAATIAALVWNIGSLIVLSPWAANPAIGSIAAAASFAALSVLPALLLSIALKGDAPILRACGWCASGIAVLLHASEAVTGELHLHRAALVLIAAVYVSLALISIFRAQPNTDRRRIASSVLGPIALILFAGSFIHFSGDHAGHPWSEEIAIHHAGIPLALFIVLQDYRFLMMDAFVRVLASSGLAGVLTLACLAANERWRLLERADDPFVAGLLVALACALLVLFAFARGMLQSWITQRIFARPSLPDVVAKLTEQPASGSESDLLKRAAGIIAAHFGAQQTDLRKGTEDEKSVLLPQLAPTQDPESGSRVEVLVPLHFSRGDSILLLLGRRNGGRRYLSEDLRDLSQLALVVAGQMERYRSERAEHLATQAELRALRAQINPHFLFNSLNALYGTIPRQAEGARRMVLNLADVFRYFLQSDPPTIALREELRIVKAYLEIEQLRLGDRLLVKFDVDPEALDATVPPLCIQPIVENGVRHGVAAQSGPGVISISVRARESHIEVLVADSGPGFQNEPKTKGAGVGLENVRQRLMMLYGPSSDIAVKSSPEGASVSFRVPLTKAASASISTSGPARLPTHSTR